MQEMKMSVSPVVRKDGRKYIYVMFQDASRTAEGRLPDGKMISNQGFTAEEIAALELYLRGEQDQIVEVAKKVNAMDAFLNK